MIAGSLAGGELLVLLVQGDKYKDPSLNYYPPGSAIYDKDIGWAYRPGFRGRYHYLEYNFEAVINSLGLRDREYGPKTKSRILFVGDSFTFGVGVDISQTYVRLVEKDLGGESTLECINAGRIAAGPQVYLHYARKYAAALDPDTIVLSLFPENDFDDTRNFHAELTRFRDVNGEPYVGDQPLARERTVPTTALYRHSALYRFLKLRFSRLSINQGVNPFVGTWLEVYLKDEPKWVGEAKTELFECVSEIANVARQRKARFALVLIPSDYDLYPARLTRLIRKWGRAPDAYDLDKPYQWLTDYAAKRDIPLLDLRAPMRAGGKTCHFQHDRHFNATGYRIAASAIAKFLTEQHLVPDKATVP